MEDKNIKDNLNDFLSNISGSDFDYDKFNEIKSKENIDEEIPLHKALVDIVGKIADERKILDKDRHRKGWVKRASDWGVNATVAISVMWWALDTYKESNELKFQELLKQQESWFSYIDTKTDDIIDSIKTTKLDREQTIVLISDSLKLHNLIETDYINNLLANGYNRDCTSRDALESCKRKVASDMNKELFSLIYKLNRFNTDVGLLGDFLKDNFFFENFIQDIISIIFMEQSKKYKMEVLEVLMTDYETEFRQRLMLKLSSSNTPIRVN